VGQIVRVLQNKTSAGGGEKTLSATTFHFRLRGGGESKGRTRIRKIRKNVIGQSHMEIHKIG